MRLKRLRSPRFWEVSRKATKWITTPRPGPHKKFESIPLQIMLRDILGIAETAKEVKAIVHAREIIIDGKPRKDSHYAVGLMDTIAIPKIGKAYRVVPSAKGIRLVEISEKESKQKLCKIENKTTVIKGKVQLNLHDGKNILVSKDEYKTGDSLLIELPSLKILKHAKLEKGSVALITKGKNAGKICEIKEVFAGKIREPRKIVCEIDKQKFTVLKDYVFVVGKAKPMIKLGE